MSLLDRVLAVAFAAAERLRGEQVVYQWDAATVLLVPAVLGRTLWQMEESPGAFVSVQGADFMIDAALFPGEPSRGQTVTRTLDGQQLCYEVLAPGKEPVFQYLDPARTKLRIHTKLVKQTGI